MTTEIATARATELTPDRVDRGLEWLKRSLQLLNDCPETTTAALRAVEALTVPAHPAKIGVEVLALLHPYFDKETPNAVRARISEKWQSALGQYPEWAVKRACEWWTGPDNVKRHQHPKEGDIAARCRVEMDVINAARLKLKSDRPAKPQNDATDSHSEAHTAEMRKRMADIGNQTLAAMRQVIEGGGNA